MPRNQDEQRGGRRENRGSEQRNAGRGHGGWFGDPEGHAQAAKKGWGEETGSSRGNSGSRNNRH